MAYATTPIGSWFAHENLQGKFRLAKQFRQAVALEFASRCKRQFLSRDKAKMPWCFIGRKGSISEDGERLLMADRVDIELLGQ